ncbi:hypothetical protein [Thermospira aquatica]|uniref:POTRA domain-containing protein n=1 Tax=Thermospira aquatica TaxID=2828656 RepID=A0AAX3BFH0_9SPIR|nr:hypothetical protein [Thermospira aquatica]URA11107.1 hypothetical protein KDW03_04740 [Thermospira aquatica]
MWRAILFLSFFLFSMVFAQNQAVLYFYRADRVANVSEGDLIVMDLTLTNVIKLIKNYTVLTRENIKEYLTGLGFTNIPSEVSPALARENATNWGITEVVELTYTPGSKRGIFVINLSVWNALEKRLVREEKIPATSGREIFDALDEVGLVLAESLTGKRLGFGSLRVKTTLKDAVIVVGNVEYETSSLTMENAIAGLVYPVMIGTKTPEGLKLVYTNTFTIREAYVYDLTYHYEEWVEVIDLKTNTNRVPRSAYRAPAVGGGITWGPSLRFGQMSLAWGGMFFSWRNLMADFYLGYTPQMFLGEGEMIYLHTAGAQGMVQFRLFPREESLWNMGMYLSVTELTGVWPMFVFYNKGWPLISLGGTSSFRWGFRWMPSWLQSLEMEVCGGG